MHRTIFNITYAYAFEGGVNVKLYDKVRARLPELFNIPELTLPGEAIIEVFGDRRILIEGSCAVLQYAPNCIKLRNQCGTVCVLGCGLRMAEISNTQTIIIGKVENISICRG